MKNQPTRHSNPETGESSQGPLIRRSLILGLLATAVAPSAFAQEVANQLGSYQAIEADDFKEIIKQGTVLVVFGANWCAPCKKLNPILEQLKGARPNQKIVKMYADRNNPVLAEYQIIETPTLLVFKNGKLTNRSSHAGDLSQLLNILSA